MDKLETVHISVQIISIRLIDAVFLRILRSRPTKSQQIVRYRVYFDFVWYSIRKAHYKSERRDKWRETLADFR